MSDERTSLKIDERPAFVIEVWLRVRPYALALISDWLIAALIWLLLWMFSRITALVPIEGWAGQFIENIHSVGSALAFGIFAGLLIWDIVEIRKGSK